MPKTIKIKKIFAWAIYQSLKQVPPKDYPTTGEIKSTITDVLPALKAQVAEYVEAFKKVDALTEKIVSKQLTEEQGKVEIDNINAELREINKTKGVEIVNVVVEDEGFKTLKAQFDREGWGKKWVATVEEFGELLEAFTQAEK